MRWGVLVDVHEREVLREGQRVSSRFYPLSNVSRQFMTAEHTEAAIFALQDLLSIINTNVPQDSASSSLFARLFWQKIEHSIIGTIVKRIASRSHCRVSNPASGRYKGRSFRVFGQTSRALAGILHLNRMLAQSLLETLQGSSNDQRFDAY